MTDEKCEKKCEKQKKTIVISKSGTYTLDEDLKAGKTVPAISIAADNVILLMNNHTISGKNRKGIGIFVSGKNCTISSGHFTSLKNGILLAGDNIGLSDLRMYDVKIGCLSRVSNDVSIRNLNVSKAVSAIGGDNIQSLQIKGLTTTKTTYPIFLKAYDNVNIYKWFCQDSFKIVVGETTGNITVRDSYLRAVKAPCVTTKDCPVIKYKQAPGIPTIEVSNSTIIAETNETETFFTVPPISATYVFKNNVIKMSSGGNLLSTTPTNSNVTRTVNISNNEIHGSPGNFFDFYGGNTSLDTIKITNNVISGNPKSTFIRFTNFGSASEAPGVPLPKSSAIIFGNSFQGTNINDGLQLTNSFGLTINNNIFNGFSNAFNADPASSYVLTSNQINNSTTSIEAPQNITVKDGLSNLLSLNKNTPIENIGLSKIYPI